MFCASGVETAAGAAGQARELAERPRGIRIIAFLEQERPGAHETEPPGQIADRVDRLFEGIADDHQRADCMGLGFLDRVLEDASDLGPPAQAAHLDHPVDQFAGGGQPTRRPALADAAVEYQLDIQTAQCIGFGKHLRLDIASDIPGRLTARRGVHRENQPPASGDGCRGLRH